MSWGPSIISPDGHNFTNLENPIATNAYIVIQETVALLLIRRRFSNMFPIYVYVILNPFCGSSIRMGSGLLLKSLQFEDACIVILQTIAS